jgi:hypothetical protein
MIDAAVDTGDFIEYGAGYDYAQGIDEILDSLDELLGEGHAAEVIELTEYALPAVDGALESGGDPETRVVVRIFVFADRGDLRSSTEARPCARVGRARGKRISRTDGLAAPRIPGPRISSP